MGTVQILRNGEGVKILMKKRYVKFSSVTVKVQEVWRRSPQWPEAHRDVYEAQRSEVHSPGQSPKFCWFSTLTFLTKCFFSIFLWIFFYVFQRRAHPHYSPIIEISMETGNRNFEEIEVIWHFEISFWRKNIFETEISAHVGCALGTPNFLDLASINPVTSSLNRIFVTFFLEKKSGGKNRGFPPPAAKSAKILDFVLGCKA